MENLWFLGVPIFKHIIMRGASENNEFFIWNGEMENILFLGVPILKHIRVLVLEHVW